MSRHEHPALSDTDVAFLFADYLDEAGRRQEYEEEKAVDLKACQLVRPSDRL